MQAGCNPIAFLAGCKLNNQEIVQCLYPRNRGLILGRVKGFISNIWMLGPTKFPTVWVPRHLRRG